MCLFLQYDAEQETSQSESDSSEDENDVEEDEVIWIVSLLLVVHSNFFNFRVLVDKVQRHIIMKCDYTLKFFVLLIKGQLLHRVP